MNYKIANKNQKFIPMRIKIVLLIFVMFYICTNCIVVVCTNGILSRSPAKFAGFVMSNKAMIHGWGGG